MTFSELLALDKTPTQTDAAPRPATPRKTRVEGAQPQASNHDTVADTTVAANQETPPPRQNEAENPRHHAPSEYARGGTMTPTMLKPLRQAVRQIGKEAATYRFTREEKDKLAETIYTQGRAGIRTCENEIVRIAVNWLIADQQARGEISVLAQALKALRE
jgi:hypothetical protein